MTTPLPRWQRPLGSVLVLAQFGLLLTLLVQAALTKAAPTPAAVVLASGALALGLWTLWHNRLGNFNIHPEPKASAHLVTSGPYRWIRHPMYSAVLLGAAALAATAQNALAWTLWLFLLAVLWAKARLEERWLTQHFPPYHAYCQHSKRFIPWVW